MERLNSADIENIMSFCKKAAEIGANPKKVFACDSKTLTFDGCVYDLPNDKVSTCDVYVEENGKKKYLYCVDYQMLGGNQFKITENGSIAEIKKEVSENKYHYWFFFKKVAF